MGSRVTIEKVVVSGDRRLTLRGLARSTESEEATKAIKVLVSKRYIMWQIFSSGMDH